MSWSGTFFSSKGLREVSRKKLSDEIFDSLKVEKEWKILIVDDFAMKILSSCFKTEEIMSFNIALIEFLDKTREPIPYLSAIYLCFPSVHNISILQHDFVSRPAKYSNAYLFFLSDVPKESFDGLVKYANPGFVQTFKVIDFLFFPYESQVFSLNDEKFFSTFFDAYKEMDLQYCAFVAKKLATLCATLKTCPRIRYRRNFVKNLILAEALEKELHNYQDSFQSSCEDSPRIEILIVDRGFDCVTPVVHECTLQAMTQDLLEITDDVYEFSADESTDEGNRSKVSLTEADSLWRKLRHEHIANVAKIIDGMVETHSLLKRYPTLSRYKSLPELGDAVRKCLAYRKIQPHFMYRRMANECMKVYCTGINVVADIMQDLAVGTIVKETFSKDVRSAVLTILCNSNYVLTEKMRLFLLYIFYANGVTKHEFDDVIVNSELPFSEARIITNVLHLDVDIFRPGFCRAVDYIPREVDEETPPLLRSRWLPAIKNVMLSCIDGTLCEDKYPYLDNNGCAKRSGRTGYWCRDKKDKYMSRLIVFIAGGVTYSEMRCAYEVMSVHTGWEVYIGGDSLLSPKIFLEKLKQLRCFISKDM